jgi:hypothetical protein
VSVAAKAVLDVISHDLAQAAAVAREFVEPSSGGATLSSGKKRQKMRKRAG